MAKQQRIPVDEIKGIRTFGGDSELIISQSVLPVRFRPYGSAPTKPPTNTPTTKKPSNE